MKHNHVVSNRIMREFGRLCASRRARLGLAVRDVARETGLSIAMVNRIELHTVQPSFAAALVLGRFYRINLQHIAKRTELHARLKEE